MSNNTTTTATNNFPLPTLLFILFLGLKLTGNITWSWVWVTAPLWIPVALVIGIFTLGFLFVLAAKALDR